MLLTTLPNASSSGTGTFRLSSYLKKGSCPPDIFKIQLVHTYSLTTWGHCTLWQNTSKYYGRMHPPLSVSWTPTSATTTTTTTTKISSQAIPTSTNYWTTKTTNTTSIATTNNNNNTTTTTTTTTTTATTTTTTATTATTANYDYDYDRASSVIYLIWTSFMPSRHEPESSSKPFFIQLSQKCLDPSLHANNMSRTLL